MKELLLLSYLILNNNNINMENENKNAPANTPTTSVETINKLKADHDALY
jgi:hypothetical protein